MHARAPRVYIETSAFNAAFADDAPDKRRDVLALFEEMALGKYVPYTSYYVVQELLPCPEPRRSGIFELMDRHAVRILPESAEAEYLAAVYVNEGVIPPKYFVDGVHIAVAAVYDMDFIVSFNFKHIVKRKTVTMTEVINVREGYRRVGIYSPTEVIDNGD